MQLQMGHRVRVFNVTFSHECFTYLAIKKINLLIYIQLELRLIQFTKVVAQDFGDSIANVLPPVK